MHCETNTNEQDKGGIELTVFLFSNDKRWEETERQCKEWRPFCFPARCICRTSNLSACCFATHGACSTQPEQSERKANSFKIDREITHNWRPFKNIITSLFPQQEVQGRGSFLIRTGDELAIKLLSQTWARLTQGARTRVNSACPNAKIYLEEAGLPGSSVRSTGTGWNYRIPSRSSRTSKWACKISKHQC